MLYHLFSELYPQTEAPTTTLNMSTSRHISFEDLLWQKKRHAALLISVLLKTDLQ